MRSHDCVIVTIVVHYKSGNFVSPTKNAPEQVFVENEDQEQWNYNFLNKFWQLANVVLA